MRNSYQEYEIETILNSIKFDHIRCIGTPPYIDFYPGSSLIPVNSYHNRLALDGYFTKQDLLDLAEHCFTE